MTMTIITRDVKWAVVNQWNIMDVKILDQLDKYYLIVTDGADVAEKNEQGELVDNGIYYKINFIDTPVTCYRSKCAISFRRIAGQETGYALVRVFRNDHKDHNNG